jgi:hypothetical protein
MQVVLAALGLSLPVAGLAVGERDPLRLVGRLIAPHVVGAVGGLRVLARGLKPRMLVGGVVDHQVNDHLDSAVAGGAHELDEVPEVPQARVDPEEVADVVAVVPSWRGIERHQPQAGDAQARQVVDLPDQPLEVTDPVAVGVEVGLHVQAVDDRVLPPQVAGLVQARRHRLSPSSAGSTCSANVSMNSLWLCPT